MSLDNILEILFMFPAIIIAIIFHEFFHGYTAYKLGDNTPKDYGRLTLDPLKHIDLFGTIILPILLLITSNFRITFGWAKPVPINFYRFKKIRRDLILTSIAGPLANIVLAFIFGLIFKFLIYPSPKLSVSYLNVFVQYGVIINIVLAIFNLIPIPPLDGSKILFSIIFKYPQDILKNQKIDIYGSLILIILLFFGIISRLLGPIIYQIVNLFLWII
ncbi:MAG: site-2 protease family protein [Caldisericia bacterium]